MKNQINVIRKLVRRESGQVLAIALILLAITGLIAVPVSQFVSSALIQGTTMENRDVQLYTADAGIQNAVHNLSIGSASLPTTIGQSWGPYAVSNLTSGVSVNVTITLTNVAADAKTYSVHSVSTRNGNSTTIDATIQTQEGKYGYFMDNVFTTQGVLGLKNKVAVNGTVSVLFGR